MSDAPPLPHSYGRSLAFDTTYFLEYFALDLIMEAIELAGHTGKIDLGTDIAASEFYDSKTNTYNLSKKNGKNDRILTPDQLLETNESLCAKYPLVSIEDPFDQDDFSSYIKM